MASSNALLSKPIMSLFAALTSLIVMLTSGCGDTDPNLLCRNDYLTVSKIYAPDTDPKSNTSQLQLFFYIEDNRNMQKINNKAFYISESEIRESDTAYFRGFTDAESEDSYNYVSKNKLSGTLLTYQKHGDGEYYVTHDPSNATTIHYINSSGELFAYILSYDDSEHKFPDDFQCDSGRVSLFFYEEDGISIETIDLTKNVTETISVNIPEFGRHHSRHGFSGNCYYDGSENFGVIVNYPKSSEYRDALCVYNRLSGEYFYIPEKDGIDNFFIGDRILLVRVNEKVLKLSYYERTGHS